MATEAKKPDEKKTKKEKKVMSPTKALTCICSSTYQDGEYGKGQRLHNLAPGNKGTRYAYRCTICSKLKE